MELTLLINILIYFLIGLACSLYASIVNSNYEAHNDVEIVPKQVFITIFFIWPLWLLLLIAVAFTRKKNNDIE
jgi:cell division protein FtsW (lipid II flippase)